MTTLRLAALVSSTCLALAACGAEARPSLVELSGETMGTTWSVELARPPADLDRGALGADVAAVLRGVDRRMSTYRPDSELSRFNAGSSTGWQRLSKATVTVLREALRVSRLTGGAFDVTVAPLVDLWGFGPSARFGRPETPRLEAARARVGYRHLSVRAGTPAARKGRADVAVDLSALAKGYAVDRVVELLESRGLRDVLVELGGEMAARGAGPDGRPWAVAVEPLPGAPTRTIRLRDAAVATSGDAAQFFEAGGRRYSHVIDPRTGSPVAHGMASVTVVHPEAMTADALATAIFVLGPDDGLDLARREGLAVLLRFHSGEEIVEVTTPEFDDHAAF